MTKKEKELKDALKKLAATKALLPKLKAAIKEKEKAADKATEEYDEACFAEEDAENEKWDLENLIENLKEDIEAEKK